MSDNTLHKTPYDDVNAAVELVISGLRAVLSKSLIGFYLGGSLSIGDFDPTRSDIDFIAVTDGNLPSKMIKAIETMHIRLWDANNKWCRRLDGSYVPKKVVRDWYPEHQPCPFVEGKYFYITNQGCAVIQRHIIRNYGTVIAGADPKTFINPVSKDGLRSTQGHLLKKWWQPLLEDQDWLNQGQKQPFAILTMCRALYTLEHGDVASKPAAAKWVKQTVGKNFATLINFALAWEPDFEFDELRPSLEFIEYTLRHYSQNYQN